MKFSSLTALEIIIMTTSSAVSDENFIKMKTFSFLSLQYKDKQRLDMEEEHMVADDLPPSWCHTICTHHASQQWYGVIIIRKFHALAPESHGIISKG